MTENPQLNHEQSQSPLQIRDQLIRRANMEFTTLCAKALKTRGFEVQQEEDVIRGDGRSEEIAGRVFSSPEGVALRSAFSGIDAEPNVNICRWDEDTKSRVSAFYFDQHALFLAQKDSKRFKLPGEHRHIQEIVETLQGLAEMLRGDLKPLTQKDIGSLVEQIVDRELTSEGE